MAREERELAEADAVGAGRRIVHERGALDVGKARLEQPVDVHEPLERAWTVAQQAGDLVDVCRFLG